MHHLHPRSRTTSTLFTTTLVISFLVVAAPHLLPCPVDRRQFADSFEAPDGKRYRRKRKELPDSPIDSQEAGEMEEQQALVQDGRPKRECPVPKPGGIVGQIMGFKPDEQAKAPEVIVQTLDTKRSKDSHKHLNDVP